MPSASLSVNPSAHSLVFDWNFYSTESSVIFRLAPTQEHPYWVEAHGHFGRFGAVPISIMITSHTVGLGDGVGFLESVLTDLFWKRLPAFFRQRGPGVGVELQPSIYYFGIRLQCNVLAYDNPKRLDLPHQARQQVERILRSIPPEELSPLAMGFEEPRTGLESESGSEIVEERACEAETFIPDAITGEATQRLQPPVEPSQQTLNRRRTAARASHAAAKQQPVRTQSIQAQPVQAQSVQAQAADPISTSPVLTSEPSPWDEMAAPELPRRPQPVLAQR